MAELLAELEAVKKALREALQMIEAVTLEVTSQGQAGTATAEEVERRGGGQKAEPTWEKPVNKEALQKGSPWQPTKNPAVEMCPREKASSIEVARAMDRNDRIYWLGDPRYGDLIFRRVKGCY